MTAMFVGNVAAAVVGVAGLVWLVRALLLDRRNARRTAARYERDRRAREQAYWRWFRDGASDDVDAAIGTIMVEYLSNEP